MSPTKWLEPSIILWMPFESNDISLDLSVSTNLLASANMYLYEEMHLHPLAKKEAAHLW